MSSTCPHESNPSIIKKLVHATPPDRKQFTHTTNKVDIMVPKTIEKLSKLKKNMGILFLIFKKTQI